MELIKFFLIFFTLSIPPFLIIIKDIKLNKTQLILLSLFYWIGCIIHAQIFPFILIIIIIVTIHKNKNIRSFNPFIIKNSFFKYLIFIGIAVIFRFIAFIINFVYLIFLQILNYSIETQEIVKVFYNNNDVYQNIFLIILIVIIAPITEEFVLRYFIFERILLQKYGIFTAMFFSSLLFTILHFNISGIPTFFLLGILLCLVYKKYGYFASVIMHSTFNIISLVLLILLKSYGFAI